MTRYDDGTYSRLHPTWHEEDADWKAAKVLALLARCSPRPRRICDIGCGGGGVLARLAEHLGSDCELMGYDISADALAIARTRERANLTFVHAAFPEAEGPSWDLALALDVFEHVEDPYGFLRRLRTVADRHVFHIPLDLSAQALWRGTPLLAVRVSVGHLHYYTKDTALALLEETGYEVLWHGYTCGSLDLPAPRLATRMMRLPRRLLSAWNPDFAARVLGGFSLLVETRRAREPSGS